MRKQLSSRPSQLGLTLVELLVAMIISLLVVAAASAVFFSSGRIFATTDASSQLQDSARFATYVLRRMILQAAYEDFVSGTGGYGNAAAARVRDGERFVNPPNLSLVLDIYGVNNGKVSAAQLRSGTAPESGVLPGGFFTDTVSIRFQGRSVYTADGNLDANQADNSMIDCLGRGVPSATGADLDARAFSTFHVDINPETNEPELYCSVVRPGVDPDRQPIVRGVESFQVLYEVGDDRFDATGGGDPNGTPESFRFVRADQVEGLNLCNSRGTAIVANRVNAWQSVTSIRFGLVLRGELDTKIKADAPETLYPLGERFASAADPGTIFVAPADTRLRRVVTFTVNVRNRAGSMQTIGKACDAV